MGRTPARPEAAGKAMTRLAEGFVPFLVFVVPTDVFPNFQAQRYLTSRGTVARSPGPKIQTVKQLVLEIQLI